MPDVNNMDKMKKVREAKGKSSRTPKTPKPISSLRQEAVNKRLAIIPVKCRNVYLKAVEGKSKSAAIKAFCLECVCWLREEITECTDLACPLWANRPFRKRKKVD